MTSSKQTTPKQLPLHLAHLTERLAAGDRARAAIPFSVGDTVFYRPQGGTASYVVRARITTRHRDGSVTLTAMCEVDPRTGSDIKQTGLGFKYRTGPRGLHRALADVPKAGADT